MIARARGRVSPRHCLAGGLALVCATVLAGCFHRHAPLDSGMAGLDNPLGGIVIPLTVRAFDVSKADDHHGVFFKLSRVPDAVHAQDASDPARIIVDVDGPSAGDDLPVQSYPGTDTLVSQIDMSRVNGSLHLILHLSGDHPPPYVVRQMADYVVVQLNPQN
jgi:hypothetical protein